MDKNIQERTIMFIFSYILKFVSGKIFSILASKYIEPILSFIKNHWKLSIALLLIGTNAYAFNRIVELKQDNITTEILLDNIILEAKINNDLLVDSITSQNSAIDTLNKDKEALNKRISDANTKIGTLNNSLRISLDALNSQEVGTECSDKMSWLREKAQGELKWQE